MEFGAYVAAAAAYICESVGIRIMAIAGATSAHYVCGLWRELLVNKKCFRVRGLNLEIWDSRFNGTEDHSRGS